MSDTKEHKRTLENTQKGTERGQTNRLSPGERERRLSKTHADYWFARLRKRNYTDRSSKTVEIPDWQVRLKKDGREAWFNLGTPNQAAAAKRAKEVFTFLEANGWEATLAKFKPNGDSTQGNQLTVGEYLRAVRDTGRLRFRTFLNYQNCFRTIVAGAFGVGGGDEKFDYKSGGNQKWIERIDRIRLERVTPDRVTAWQRKFVAQAGKSPVALASAKRTANSYVRCARSLFSSKLTKALKGVTLPERLPFNGVELFGTGSMKYISKVNVQSLIAAARGELKETETEVYKAFLLGLFAGMRKGEIDLAEWRMVDWQNNLIRLEETEWLHLKTKDSAGEIMVDPEMLAELREMLPRSQSQFILTSDRPPRNDSARPYYRCERIFDRLTEWLRSKGVRANKPLHELRKEIGALVATEHGIYAASRFLRHSDITTTARHYAEHKARISVGLGKLLDTDIKSASTKAAGGAA
ncbi:MAG: tyrosine-type recombinase/integrase [Verrucomicrobia bacterium]|nr:tyrosine-type recombinase/integrase [Verrucomicrobiota bacterium]